MKKSLGIVIIMIGLAVFGSCDDGGDITVKTPVATTPKITAVPMPTIGATQSPTPMPTVDPSTLGEEMYLTSMEYTDFYLNGQDEPFYGYIPHTGEYLEVAGVRFKKGVFINPVSGGEAGYITYNIEGLPYNRFAAKVGKLDVVHGNGDPIVFKVYVDNELIAESTEMTQGEDAYLIDIEIEPGKKELMLECAVMTADHTECSGVFGDARLCYKGAEIAWPAK